MQCSILDEDGNFALLVFSADAEYEEIDWDFEDPTYDFEIWRCTDATASNFDPSATADDGSCFILARMAPRHPCLMYAHSLKARM